MTNEFDRYLAFVRQNYSDCNDLACRVSAVEGGRFATVFIKAICSRDYISETVIKPVLRSGLEGFRGDAGALLGSATFSVPADESESVFSIAAGEALLLLEYDGGFTAVLVNAQDGQGRSVQEPSSDVTVRGPKAGFVEDAETNFAMLRKYVRSPALKSKMLVVGTVSRTKVLICYVAGRASERFVGELTEKIGGLKASVITDSSNIPMLIEGEKDPLLPVCGSSEKVDKVASKLMAGRVAVIVDGSPFVLTAPYVFAESLQAADDYLHTPFYATFIRILRLIAFLASIFAPGVLCALLTYEHAFLPQEFYGFINKSRDGVPVSFFFEILTVLLLFELLREVGVRMPRPVGDAVGIVGSIILGNTAVDAGIVSSVGVITVAFAAVCAFITPAYMYVIVLFRLSVLVLAQIFGVFGIGLSATLLIILFAGSSSFGVPYLFPLSPRDANGMQDFVFAWPRKTLGRRERLGKKR